ncbi:MAG: 23S rRNA (adenine(2503)-C(2))-methyltransferase RlmN [Gemmatimonadota bacterium]
MNPTERGTRDRANRQGAIIPVPSGASKRIPALGLPPRGLRAALEDLLAELGEPGYRAPQIASWIHTRGARTFDEMTSLPKALRDELRERISLSALEAETVARSEDGSIKHLWRLADGERVESVLIPSGRRVTLCLSSQAGCGLGCTFCATGHFGFRRNLSAAEIVTQYRDALRVSLDELGRPIANVVYMGMGEPFANREAVLASLRVLHEGFGLGARRITVSTVGLIPGIRDLASLAAPFRLAVSLHAPNHDLRLRLVPIERRYPLPDLFEALRAYQERKRRRITFEYTLIRDVNDGPELAQQLADLLVGLDAYVNLIPLNPIPASEWRPSSPQRIARFARELEARAVPAAVRRPRGRDIAAACGQLRLESASATAGRDPG